MQPAGRDAPVRRGSAPPTQLPRAAVRPSRRRCLARTDTPARRCAGGSDGSSSARAASPARGPSASPTATARFRRAIGLPVSRTSSSYQDTICGQSVSSAVSASACRAATAACVWYSPSRSAASARCRMSTPSVIRPVSQRQRSCWASGTSLPPSSVRAGRRA